MMQADAPSGFPPPDKRRRPNVPEAKAQKTPSFAAGKPKPVIVRVLADVGSSRLSADVQALAGFKTRHSLSPDNAAAGQWLRDQFLAIGYADVVLHDFDLQGTTCHNVICTKRGTSEPDTYLLIGAHYDSRMNDLEDAASPAPGSDDNGSGVAALLEIGRVLRDVEIPCSIRFAAFSGEEQGLKGSEAYAAAIHAQGLKVRLMINLDMIGHPTPAGDPKMMIEHDIGNAHPSNDEASLAAAKIMAEAALTYTSLRPEFGPIYDSDYMPFEAAGYACIGVFDGANNESFYHSSNDTPSTVDARYHAEAVRMVTATILAIALEQTPVS